MEGRVREGNTITVQKRQMISVSFTQAESKEHQIFLVGGEWSSS